MAYYRLQKDIFVDDATGVMYEDQGPTLGMVAIGASGAAYVAVQTDTTYPEYIAEDDSVTLAASGVGAAIIISTTKPKVNVTFKITGLTGETVSIFAYLNEALSIETAALRPIDLNTGAVAAASTLGNGSYLIKDIPAYGLHWTKSSTAETPVITYVVS